MRSKLPYLRDNRPSVTGQLAEILSELVVGQPAAISTIVPFIEIHEAGLAPEGRPAGVFLLLGPTGTGKTRTVEAVAEALHGTSKKLLKVDCGEFQMEHEVAKLIGAPPGYLGHRETQPLLTQNKLAGVISQFSELSIVLFDEIEKAAPSMARLLLGVLDKATLRLGDNTVVNFDKTLIFLTSNLGARSMGRLLRPTFGFEAMAAHDEDRTAARLETIGLSAVRKRFSPEFVEPARCRHRVSALDGRIASPNSRSASRGFSGAHRESPRRPLFPPGRSRTNQKVPTQVGNQPGIRRA